MLDKTTRNIVNDVDLDTLGTIVDAIEADPGQAMTNWKVTTDWTGQFRSQSMVEGFRIGGQQVDRAFKIVADEPFELLGTNSAPNPQELLLSAINACMMVGYIAQASTRGVKVESCRIETEGDIDLRGFLGMDEEVANGYQELRYTVHLEADCDRAMLEEIHAAVCNTSPNHFNASKPITMIGTLA